jgi:peroxidase
VNRAISEAKRKLGNFVPSAIHELSSNLPKSVHIAVPAEMLQEATRLLAQWFNLPKELILFALPKINTLKTNVKQVCPAFLLPVKCEVSKYRTLTGMCNNLQYPSWGSARSAFVRFLPPNYGDGKF